ncbi:MAG: RNA polymerase sigma factor [Rhodobacterales bacterium]|nr:RNA polymerase sigma factor [Rhodobacterales bacterium]
MAQPHDPKPALTRIMHEDRGRLMAALVGALGHFDLAEEALADALESAMIHWGRAGEPDRPQGWLLRVARRKAIDRIRRQTRWRDRLPDLDMLARADEDAASDPAPDIPDDRLRLIFTCCHPALDPKSRVALTLRTIAGLSTAEIARAFLDQEPTMGQRLSRAKARIAATGIPFAVPGPEEWPDRLNSVLTVIYLVFNEGYAATAGDTQIRAALCEEAIFLARLMAELTGDDPEVAGLLSLMLTTHARRPARMASVGTMIPLDEQDRALWDKTLISEGLAMLDRALVRLTPGPCQIKAAISALHVQAASHAATDWRQMLLLYDSLYRFEPTAVVRLNRAVVVAQLGGLTAAIDELESLSEPLEHYQPFHAARADLLSRAGQIKAAQNAYSRAIELSGTKAERAFLLARAKSLTGVAKKKPGARPG